MADTRPLSERLAEIADLPSIVIALTLERRTAIAEAVELARRCEASEWQDGQGETDRNEAAIRKVCAKKGIDLSRGAAQLLVNYAIEHGAKSISVEMDGVFTAETGEEHGDWIITARRVRIDGDELVNCNDIIGERVVLPDVSRA